MTVDVEAPLAERGTDYARLSKQVRAAGLLERRPGYYLVKIAITVVLFAAGWVAFFRIGASWYNLITAAFLAVMSTQVAFIGHDSGHKQIFATHKANNRISFVLGNFVIGMSTGWWVDKHNRHHANPNHIDKDPDIAVGALVYTEPQAVERGPAGRFLSRHQAWLFFPMLLLEGISLHLSSFRAMLGNTVKSRWVRGLETFLLLLHVALYGGAVFGVLGLVRGLVFIAVNQGLWGMYMGLSFAPNHKGMLMLTKEDELDFLRKQVLTSRNIRGDRFVDWLLGGLNYQIEHHLFPSMPRPSLRRAQPIVRAFCAEIGVSYTEVGAGESYATVLRHLDEVGADA
jgi:fatty acid desaturase